MILTYGDHAIEVVVLDRWDHSPVYAADGETVIGYRHCLEFISAPPSANPASDEPIIVE